MATKYAVVRTDLMSMSDVQFADAVHLRFYGADDKTADVENGVIAKIGDYEDGQREIRKATAAAAGDDLDKVALLAAPELMYDERKHNLEEFINEAGKPIRGYRLHNGNLFSVTAEAFVGGTAPTVGATVGIGANGKIDASGTGLGVCDHIETIGRYTFYMIRIVK